MGWNERSDPDMRTANFKFSCDVYREGVYYCTHVPRDRELKQVKLSFARWSKVCFFWARAPETRELQSLSNSAWLLN